MTVSVIVLIVLGSVAAVSVVLTILTVKNAETHSPSFGTVSVSEYDRSESSDSSPRVQAMSQSRISLASFGLKAAGFPKGCCFVWNENNKRVYFVANKPVYSNMTAGAVKKIRIDGSGMPVIICPSPEMEKGIEVTFTDGRFHNRIL